MPLFGDPTNKASWSPRVWKPLYSRIIREYWLSTGGSGSQAEIARLLAINPDLVSKVINSETGKEMLKSLENQTFDSMIEVHNQVQAVASELLAEKIKLALHSPNESIRNRACTELLAIAGHTPLHRVSIERPNALDEEYKNKTPDMLRDELLKLKDNSPDQNRGPDGTLLN